MIIAFYGPLQAGKSTGAKYITGLVLKHIKLIDSFKIQGDDLIVNASIIQNNTSFKGEFPLDIKRKDYDFIKYAERAIYPDVKVYSFADPLKECIHKLFGIPYELLYGSNEQKNQLTHILWDDAIKLLSKKDAKKNWAKAGCYMTVRELMQFFGTEVCRTISPDCHANACYNSILVENPNIALIDDCRFINEVTIGHTHNAKIFKLKRRLEESSHDSEQEIPDEQFDYIIPDSSLEEKHEHINIALKSWGLEYLL